MKTKTLLLTALLTAGSVAAADAGHVTKTSAHKGSHEQYYVRVEGGMSMPSKSKVGYGDAKDAAGAVTQRAHTTKQKSKNSYTFGISGGYIFNEFFRADATLGYKEYKYKTVPGIDGSALSKVKTFSLMANGYLEAHNDTIFTPYLLAGFGIGRLDPKLSNTRVTQAGLQYDVAFKSKKSNNFIWNLGAGVRAKVMDSADVDLTYKYVTLGDAKFNGTSTGVAAPKPVSNFSGKAKSLKGHEVLAGLMFRF